MGLSWLLHSVCHVLGSPKDTNIQCNPRVGHLQVERVQGDHVNSLKVPDGRLPETQTAKETCHTGFQMPLHYPRYKKADYEKMEEWKVDLLLLQYGLDFKGALAEKRAFAMGAFLWPESPDQF